MSKEPVTHMPKSQMSFLLKLLDSPNKRGFAEGKSEGAVAKALYKKNYICPKGKVGRKIEWQLHPEIILDDKWFSEADFKLMRELVRNN